MPEDSKTLRVAVDPAGRDSTVYAWFEGGRLIALVLEPNEAEEPADAQD